YGGRVRLSEFWERMRDHFGAGYAEPGARDHVLDELAGWTVEQAPAAGEELQQAWGAGLEGAPSGSGQARARAGRGRGPWGGGAVDGAGVSYGVSATDRTDVRLSCPQPD